MRNVIRAGVLALAGLTLAAADAAAQNVKIAYINSQTILQRAPGRAQAEDAYNKEMAGYRTQLEAMGDSLEKMVADYRKSEATLAQADKEAQQLRIRTRQEAYQKRAGELEQQAQKRQFELVQPIMEQIRTVLEEIRAAEGYAFILDAGSESGVIVAADKNLDITEKVIARLKPVAAAPGGARQTPAATTPAAGGPRSAPAGVSRPPVRPPSR